MKRRGVLLLVFGALLTAAPPGAIVTQQVSGHNVSIPPGFRISVWAQLPGPRFLAVSPDGGVLISQPDSGRVTLFRPDPNGGAPSQATYLDGLNLPQGLAFDTIDGVTYLYVGETDRISRYVWGSSTPRLIVGGLPDGGNHALKTIAVGPDHALYVGIGSSCNVCVNDKTAAFQRASIYRFNPDGSGAQLVARGLRNAEGLALVPGTSQLWAAVNGRDEILYPNRDSTNQYGQLVRSYVDDHPPDLFTSVSMGGNYGWPFCNANPDSPSGYNNMPLDRDFEMNSDGQVDCNSMSAITKGIPAHSAPLGLHFLQQTAFAGPWRNGAVVALHGSWDRTVPSGYKVVWFPFDSGVPGEQIDLIGGLFGLGRPVDTAVMADGSMLIADDYSGTIYRLEWAPSAVSSANGYPVIAPQSYATVYSAVPLPVSSGGFTLTMTDANGKASAATLIYASATQLNFIVPQGMAEGTAHLTMTGSSGPIDLGTPEIRSVAPGIFTVSGNGTGAAAITTTHSPDGTVYVSIYGTGIRNARPGSVQAILNGVAVPVLYAGPQPTYPGLDQVNIALPAAIAGKALVYLSIDGVTSNTVEVTPD